MDEEEPTPQPQDRTAAKATTTGDDDALRTAIEAYTAALKAAFEPCRVAGALQADLAAALHIHPGTMSRYFTGQRILHYHLLPAFARHLASLGHPLSSHQQRELELLERDVRRNRSSDGTRIAELEDERDGLQTELTAVQESLRQALADVHDRDQELAGSLTQARSDADRLRRALAEQNEMITTLRSRYTDSDEARRDAEAQAAAETARADELADQLSDANTQLSTAARLLGETDQEATRAKERVTALRTEIAVLRRQVSALLEEPSAPGEDPAELATAQLKPPVAARAITPASPFGTTRPTPVPTPRPAPAPPFRSEHTTARERRRRRALTNWSWPEPTKTSARTVAMIFSLLLAASAAAVFAVAHVQQYAYTHAAPCTTDQIRRADTSDCLTQQSATVTSRAHKTHDDSTSYTVTVRTAEGKHKTWGVDGAFYDGVPAGTRVAVNTYKGTIVTLTHGTQSADLSHLSLASPWQILAPFALMTAASIPLIVTGDRFFRNIKLFGVGLVGGIWNAAAEGYFLNSWRPEGWTSIPTAILHALAWALVCVPPLAMAAAD